MDHLNSQNFGRIEESFTLEEFNRVDIPGVIILLAITNGGAILGIIIFFGERIYFYYTHRVKTRTKPTSISELVNMRGFVSFKDEIRNKELRNNQSILNLKFFKNTDTAANTKQKLFRWKSLPKSCEIWSIIFFIGTLKNN